MKPVLMIHEIKDSLFDLDLENYILTFDDGLYSHFYHYDKFLAVPTEKIYFISTNIISRGPQSTEFPSSIEAHKKAFQGNYEDFMNLEQIIELSKQPMVSIGGHGHEHKDLNSLAKITDKIKFIMKDTKSMVKWFKENLGYYPKSFCFPYNNDLDGIYKRLVAELGITNFYGKERTAA